MGSRHFVNWDDATVTALKADWDAGFSCSQIAARIGNGCTRNAVIGKVHRIGLPGRAQPAPRHRKTILKPGNRPIPPTVMPLRRAIRPSVAPLKRLPMSVYIWPVDPGDQPRGAGEAVLSLRRGECHWPVGNPNDTDFHFCCRLISDDSRSYCEGHSRMAHAPAIVAPKMVGTVRERIV
jgi:GcrA cell cycle regulator